MYQAYAGRIQNGVPVLMESVQLPENANILITVLDRDPIIKSKAQRQGEAIKRFVSAINETSDNHFTDEDFTALENNRADFSREAEI